MLNENSLITIALVIIFILYFISYNLYINFNYHNGSYIGIKDTIKNIFNLLPEFDFSFDKENPVKQPNPIKKPSPLIVKRKKEVYNIDSNDFTYYDAPLVCKALGAELATYNQVLNAHKEGANWCNYGWSSNQLALYPIQKDMWDKLQQNEDNGNKKNSCGKPGVNGGYFNNKNLKFGVNCYGHKIDPDPSKIVYGKDTSVLNTLSKKSNKLNKFKSMISKNDLEIRPFNTNKWSKYSYKKSTYLINPEYIDNTIDNTTSVANNIKSAVNTTSVVNNTTSVVNNINELDKDPNNISNTDILNSTSIIQEEEIN